VGLNREPCNRTGDSVSAYREFGDQYSFSLHGVIRFVLADTEALHHKISQMSERIRQLEDALAILQSVVSPGEQHPLLNRDLVAVKSIIDLHTGIDEDKVSKGSKAANEDNYIQAFGTLALRNDGAATFYGPSAGHEVLWLFPIVMPAKICDQTRVY